MNRLILLASANSYRTGDFEKAAKHLGIEVVLGMDVPAPLAHTYNCSLPLDYLDLKRSTRAILRFVEENPVRVILSADDSATVLAAEASQQLGLPHNDPAAAEAARDKYVMRQVFAKAGVPSPNAERFLLSEDLEIISTQIHTDETQIDPDSSDQKNQNLSAFNQRNLRPPSLPPLKYPVVIKPRHLSGSRGVVRANNPAEFVAAVNRIRPIIERTGGDDFLVENFIPGVEVALEGLLDSGRLNVLALFDKPDPLDGPFFEETIYVTPSRLPAATQQAIYEATTQAAAALGLRNGPLHAELRINDLGPWLVEVAGRSIGGLCSRTLRFGTDMSLEELILRQAFEMGIDSAAREGSAGGVMMIPIPTGGVFIRCEGLDDAQAVPGIESIEITAKPNYSIYPLPEGDSYLGFIFARGAAPEAVEAALRGAHKLLQFEIAPEIVVFSSNF
jgi:biotin carboxylase